ncbi:MAG: amidohydrolase family protein [Planctomycetota bacterium]
MQKLIPQIPLLRKPKSSAGLALGLAAAFSTALAVAKPSTVLAPASTPEPPSGSGAVAIHAGTIYAVAGDSVFKDGVIVIEDGKVAAIGSQGSVEVPAGATSIDYGSEAVIIPGLVAADSTYARQNPSERTADPTLLAIDQFDPYSNLVSALKSGVTTVYMAPARGRLIAGQGAVVKSGGGELGSADGRVLLESAGLHGSISEEARRTPGYWEPPVPATVDVGLGVESPQLPRTTMGAVLALDELMALAGGDRSFEEEYGRRTGPALAKAMKDGVRWRLGAETPGEVQAVIDVAKRYGFPLVIDGASRAASMAEAIAEAGYPVIARPHYERGRNVGKDQTADWPTYDTIARLVGEGVHVSVATPGGMSTAELRFAAALAMRGGLSETEALKTITLNPAEVLGVQDRVGSLAPGKDADMVVLTGSPMSVGSSVVATYVGGTEAWSPAMAASLKAKAKAKAAGVRSASFMAPSSVVISVDELHVGNGVVHSPGEILVRDGKIAQVAPQVGRPAGAAVVRGAAAMPGMIDAYGHLGTEGGRRSFSTRVDLTRILEPGDYADRQVAKNGVTTVNMISRNLGSLTPSIAYKPAASGFDHLVIDPVASVRMEWDSNIVAQSGNAVRQTLQKAKEYVASWDKYEADMAKWTPPAEEPAAAKKDDEDFDDEEDSEEVCPPGCDQALYEKVCDLRERRLDQEEVIAEFQRAMDQLKKDKDALTKKQKNIETGLKALDGEMTAFQKEKQGKLNEIDVVVTLRAHQMEYLVDERLPEDLSQALVFSGGALSRLRSRIKELVQEKAALRRQQKELRREHVNLSREKSVKETRIAELQSRAYDVQMLKFGQLIDLDVLDRMGANKNAEDMKANLVRQEEAHAAELRQWDRRIEQANLELSRMTAENTECLTRVATLTRRQKELETQLASAQTTLFTDSAAARRKEIRERDRLVQLVNAQAKSIDALKAEIQMLRRKGGHVFVQA